MRQYFTLKKVTTKTIMKLWTILAARKRGDQRWQDEWNQVRKHHSTEQLPSWSSQQLWEVGTSAIIMPTLETKKLKHTDSLWLFQKKKQNKTYFEVILIYRKSAKLEQRVLVSSSPSITTRSPLIPSDHRSQGRSGVFCTSVRVSVAFHQDILLEKFKIPTPKPVLFACYYWLL